MSITSPIYRTCYLVENFALCIHVICARHCKPWTSGCRPGLGTTSMSLFSLSVCAAALIICLDACSITLLLLSLSISSRMSESNPMVSGIDTSSLKQIIISLVYNPLTTDGFNHERLHWHVPTSLSSHSSVRWSFSRISDSENYGRCGS